VLALMFLSLFAATIAMQCMPPLFSEITEQIPLTKVQMGTIMGVITLASLFFAPIGGALSDKLGARWAFGIAAIIVALAGSYRYVAGSATDLIVCMFLLGAGMAMYAPNLPKALGNWFQKKDLAMANGISISGMGIGGAIAMATAKSVLSPSFGGWRSTMVVLGGLVLLVAILWMIVYRDRPVEGAAQKKKPNVFKNFKDVLKVRDIWLIAFYYGLNMVSLLAVITLLPITLEERGLEKSGEMVGIMMGATVVFNILGGMLSDRVGKRKPFLLICAVVFGLCVLGFANFTGTPLLVVLIIAGAAMGTIAPVLMSVPVEMDRIGTALAGSAVGFIFMLGNTGGFVGPVVAGKLMDMSDTSLPGFIFIAAALIVSAVFIIPMKETGRKRKPGEAPAAHGH
jgi:nitrate/nitrite transporter NarK